MHVDVWAQSFLSALSHFWEKVIGILPNILATLLIVVVGLYLAKLCVSWLNRITKKLGFDRLCEYVGVGEFLEHLGVGVPPHELLGKVIYFFLILVILVSGADALGLDRVSLIMDSFILYLPRLLGVLVIVFVGLLVARFVKVSVYRSLQNSGVDYAEAVTKLLQLLIYFTTASLAIDQMEIETGLLNNAFSIVLASFGVAAAIALGLGTRGIALNIVSGIYAREQLQAGDSLSYQGFDGTIVEISTVNTIVENEKGERLSIPNQYLTTRSFKYTCWHEEDQ